MHFEFATATQIVFGAGAIQKIGSLAQSLGNCALVVHGSNLARAATLLATLQSSGVATACFSVSGEPELSTVERGVTVARSAGCNLVIGFGGGSVIDAAKAIAAMLTNNGELLDYLEVIGHGKALAKPSAPFIAIPTTAGTGSEVTRNAVLASPEHRVKVSLRSPFMLARVALIDPELTYGLPPTITASTGLDALTQLIEPYVCGRANPITDSLCVWGIRRAAHYLRTAFMEGTNTEARENLSVASLFGGFALANAGLGAVHGFAGPIGGMFPAPHGAICAALLPHVMAMNIRTLRQRMPDSGNLRRYDDVARLVTRDTDAEADDGVRWVTELVRDLQIPGLRAYGLREGDIGKVVEKAANASSMKANPIALTAEELAETMRAAW